MSVLVCPLISCRSIARCALLGEGVKLVDNSLGGARARTPHVEVSKSTGALSL